MVSKIAMARLRKEQKLLLDNPSDLVIARPDEKNLLMWHYLLEGPPETDFAGGWYWGKLRFPKNYPMAPPRIIMATPNGRFEINTRLCLSMSDYHPETWEPSWTISTVLQGLLSFMVEDTRTAGSVDTTSSTKRNFARASLAWNRSQDEFRMAFPDIGRICRKNQAASSSAIPDEIEEDVSLLQTVDAPKILAEARPAIVKSIPTPATHFPKTQVVIQGLRSKPFFNGKQGEIFGTREDGRYKVRVHGTALALREANFTAL